MCSDSDRPTFDTARRAPGWTPSSHAPPPAGVRPQTLRPPPNEPAQGRCWDGPLVPEALDELVRRAIASTEVTKLMAETATSAARTVANELLEHQRADCQRYEALSAAVDRINDRRVLVPLVGLTTSAIALLVAMAALLLSWRALDAIAVHENQHVECELVAVPQGVVLR